MLKTNANKIQSVDEFLAARVSEQNVAAAIGYAIGKEKTHKRIWAAIRPFLFFALALAIFGGVFVFANWPAIKNKLKYQVGALQDNDKLVTEALISDILNSKKLDIAKPTDAPQVKEENPQSVADASPVQDDRLLIPKIGVDAPIIFIDSENERDLLLALQKGVIHYPRTGTPDVVSNTVITGHSSNYWWDTGSYNYVFSLLPDLQPGDQAVVYYKSKKYVYAMSDSVVVNPYGVEPYLQSASKPQLSLITCVPVGTAWNRIIVRFDLIEAPAPEPQVGGQPSTNQSTVPVPKLRPVWQDLVDDAWRNFSEKFVLKQ